MVSQIVTGRCYKNAPCPPSLSSGQDRRSLPIYPGYEFDAEGNAYSYHVSKRYGRKMRLWPDTEKGYLMVPLKRKHGKVLLRRINRIICTLWHGPPPTPKHQARHLNGIKTDNRAVNLGWGTQSQNEFDKAKHGTRPVGEKAHSAKLTEAKVRRIRASKKSTRALAAQYGVSQGNICAIRRRRTWKHVT